MSAEGSSGGVQERRTQSERLFGAATPKGCVPDGQFVKVLVHWDASVAPVELVEVPFGQGAQAAEPEAVA